jgi:hypothetical protein
MIIFNTTFCADTSEEENCLHWIRQHYIPRAITSGDMHSPLLSKIMSDHTEGVNYSLQLHVADMQILEKWYEHTGDKLHTDLCKKFGEKVVGFSTLLKKIEI